MQRITQIDSVQENRKNRQLFRQVQTRLSVDVYPLRCAVRKIDAILKLTRGAIVRRKLSAADLNEARTSGLTDDEIVETVANVVLNIFSNCTNEVARTGEDFREVTRSNDQAFLEVLL